jgi:hypothetical protein
LAGGLGRVRVAARVFDARFVTLDAVRFAAFAGRFAVFFLVAVFVGAMAGDCSLIGGYANAVPQ